MKRFANVVQLHSETWRAPNADGVAKLVSLNHPSLAKVDLNKILTWNIEDALWALGADVRARAQSIDTNVGTLHLQVYEAAINRNVGTSLGVTVPVLGALPLYASSQMMIAYATWKNKCRHVLPGRCFNDHAYVGSGPQHMESWLTDQVPRTIEYA
jgi:hypothetical protein